MSSSVFRGTQGSTAGIRDACPLDAGPSVGAHPWPAGIDLLRQPPPQDTWDPAQAGLMRGHVREWGKAVFSRKGHTAVTLGCVRGDADEPVS